MKISASILILLYCPWANNWAFDPLKFSISADHNNSDRSSDVAGVFVNFHLDKHSGDIDRIFVNPFWMQRLIPEDMVPSTKYDGLRALIYLGLNDRPISSVGSEKQSWAKNPRRTSETSHDADRHRRVRRNDLDYRRS